MVARSNWPALLFAEQGVARHQGASYLMEDVHVSGTPQMITPLASGDLDIGMLAYSSFALAIENAEIEDLPVIADDFQEQAFRLLQRRVHGAEGRSDPHRRGSQGKVLATNGAGRAVDIAPRAMLRKHGLGDKRDVTVVEIGLPNLKGGAEREEGPP